MHTFLRRLLGFLLVVTALAGSVAARGQASTSSTVTMATSASGREVVTIDSADKKFRLVIEDTDGTSMLAMPGDRDEDSPDLDATMVARDGDKENVLWRTKVSGAVYQFSKPGG